jgi:hypothetical protein
MCNCCERLGGEMERAERYRGCVTLVHRINLHRFFHPPTPNPHRRALTRMSSETYPLH